MPVTYYNFSLFELAQRGVCSNVYVVSFIEMFSGDEMFSWLLLVLDIKVKEQSMENLARLVKF